MLKLALLSLALIPSPSPSLAAGHAARHAGKPSARPASKPAIAAVATAAPDARGCTAMVESFCDTLQSPEHQGNWDLKVGKDKLEIRLGLTENDFTFPQFRGMELLLQNEAKLPDTLREELEQLGYFKKLKKFLGSKPFGQSSPQDRVEDVYLGGQIENLWRDAIKAAVFRRLEKMHPGYSKTRRQDRPPLWLLEEKDLNTEIRIAANRATWETSPEWDQAKAQFEKIRVEMVALLRKARGISEPARAEYIRRIETVALMPPGTAEEHLDDDCSIDLANAYYHYKDNSIHVCAGLLVSVNSLFTVAHELAHTLDPITSAYMALVQSRPGQLIEELKSAQCSGKPLSCERWAKARQELEGWIRDVPALKLEPQAFFKCFQTRKVAKMDSRYVQDLASRWALDDLEEFANQSAFLELTRPEATLNNGKKFPNPAYLNPCKLQDWNGPRDDFPVNSTTPLLIFFTAEYACTAERPAVDRLRNAIETAKRLQIALNQKIISLPGPFSANSRLVSEGYAEDIGERVADALGTQAMARVIGQVPDLNGRRKLYFSVLADRCETPSWKTRYPEEADVENDYSFDPHTRGTRRLQESLLKEVRELIACDKDFELKECRID